MTRRLVIAVVLCVFAALALASPAVAQSEGYHDQRPAKVGWGCNAPDLVPASKEPPMWATLAPAFCIHRTKQVISSPWDIVVAHDKGFWWCFDWSLKPTSPGGAILGWFTASHFCSSRAWYYVQVIT